MARTRCILVGAVSGRGPLWVRSVAGLSAVGAWAATLASSLFAALALAPIQASGESRSARPDQGAAGADRALPSGRVQL
jgi:hypothetical protein